MDNNYGSFGAALGGGGPLEQAMARRGYDAGILNQTSFASQNPNANLMPAPTRQTNNAMPPQAPMNNPMPQPAQPPMAPQMPQQAPQQLNMMPTTPPPTSSYPVMPQAPQGPQQNPEAQMILNALTDRLKHHSSIEKANQQLQTSY